MSDLPVISSISPVTPVVLPLHHASKDTAAASPREGGGGGGDRTETTHGLFSNPIVDRRGGPMDMIDPSGSEVDYHQNRPPLRPQTSVKSGCSSSSQSQQSFVSAVSSLSDQSPFASNSNIHFHHTLLPNPPLLQPQQDQHPAHYPSHVSGPTISPTLTTASGHLAPPPPEKSKSRRWSLTGRFFDKRKSITEPFHIPSNSSQPPLVIATSYSSNNSNIVHGANGGNQPKGERTSNGHGNADSDSPTTPPSSNGGNRRSSIADIPKAFLSSLRRVSISGPPSLTCSANGNSGSNGSDNSGAQASGLFSAGVDETDRRRSGQSDSSEKASWLGEKPLITMAVPKAPPQDPSVLGRRPPPKSILKKRPPDLNANALADPGMVTSAALAGVGVSKTANNASDDAGTRANDTGSVPLEGPTRRLSALASEDIHPMATPDMDFNAIKLLASSADHRARLVTNSPPPSRPHDAGHPVSPVAPAEVRGEMDSRALMGGAGSPPPGGKSINSDNSSCLATAEKTAERPSQGAAIPPDFTPGMQSNLHKGRGGERAQGAVGPDDMSQDELLTHQMLTLGARAQGLAQQYYSPGSDSQDTAIQEGLRGGHGLGVSGGHGGLMVPGSGGQQGGPKQRSINFLDRIEIIPAYRKADYNRSSDKHATFRILTPDLKSEIRDELNTYKMREMAVHVESMGNTAFH